jgi:hypothetical protein
MTNNDKKLRNEIRYCIRRYNSVLRHRREKARNRLQRLGPQAVDVLHELLDIQSTKTTRLRYSIYIPGLALVLIAILSSFIKSTGPFYSWGNLFLVFVGLFFCMR